MVKILFSILLVLSSLSFAQSGGFELRSWTKKDTVLLKWIPESATNLKLGLQNGYLIEKKTTTWEKIAEIGPWSERRNAYPPESKAELLDEFISADAQVFNHLYFLLVVGSGPSREISEMLGIYFEDLNLEGDKTVEYRISIINQTSLNATWKTDTKKIDKNLDLTELTGLAKARRGEVYLAWNGQELEGDYSAYWIQKSEDGKEFLTINPTPWVYFVNADFPDKKQVEFVDTAVVEGETYYYRIQGVNNFAELGKVSNTIEIKIPRGLEGATIIDSVVANEYKRVIEGKYKEGKENEITFIDKFSLYKSDSVNFGYKKIADQKNKNGLFNFEVNSVLRSGDRQYFKVAAIGFDNDTVYSFPYYFFTLDQEPPQVPLDLVGEISDSGVVTLSWSATSDNDIEGYRLFRSNSLSEEFVEVTKELKTDLMFYDTLSLRNLTSEIYYSIRSIDQNFNNSEMSEPILVLKPDIIPPVPGIINYYKTVDGTLQIGWINSSSEDVEINYLVRTSAAGIRDTAYSWSNSDTLFIDELLNIPGDYKYTVVSVDAANNKGVSPQIQITYEPGYRKAVYNFKGKINEAEKAIDLSWKNASNEDAYAVYIYRATNEAEKYHLIETLYESKENKFADTQIAINNHYNYKVKVLYASGISSKMSESIKVRY